MPSVPVVCLPAVAIAAPTGGFNRPANVTTQVSGSSGNWSILVDWDAPTVDVAPASYLVELSVDNVNWGSSQIVTHPTTQYTYTALTGNVYYVRVRANYSLSSSGFVTVGPIVTQIVTSYLDLGDAGSKLDLGDGTSKLTLGD